MKVEYFHQTLSTSTKSIVYLLLRFSLFPHSTNTIFDICTGIGFLERGNEQCEVFLPSGRMKRTDNRVTNSTVNLEDCDKYLTQEYLGDRRFFIWPSQVKSKKSNIIEPRDFECFKRSPCRPNFGGYPPGSTDDCFKRYKDAELITIPQMNGLYFHYLLECKPVMDSSFGFYFVRDSNSYIPIKADDFPEKIVPSNLLYIRGSAAQTDLSYLFKNLRIEDGIAPILLALNR